MIQNLFPCPECDAGQNPNAQVYQGLGDLQGRQLPCSLCNDDQKVSYEKLRKYFDAYGNSSALNQYILENSENSGQQ
jgi:hypothetical protein